MKERLALLRECKICGWQWFKRGEGEPERCPKCKNTGWNIGRRRKLRKPD